jgi:sulfur carrier protein ThiS
MVTVAFKLSEIGTVSLDIDEPVPFSRVLHLCAQKTSTDIGGVIAVRDGRLLSQEDLVHNGDHIDVFPAISGG